MTTEGSDSARHDVDRRSESVGLDPVAALALACGVAGIFLFQLLLAPLTMVLAAVAGQRARKGPWDVGYAYTAFAVGAVDGLLLLFTLITSGSAPPPIPH